MKRYSKLIGLVIWGVSITGIAKAGERCGKNTLSSIIDKVCFDYSASELLVTERDSGVTTTYPMFP